MKTTHQPNFFDNLKKGFADKGLTTRSFVAFFVFGMIVLVFIFSGMTGNNSGAGLGIAAEINGEIISLKDFTDEENRLSQYYAQLFGGQFDMGAQKSMLRGQVMNTIINKALGSQAAEKEGIFATDAEIRQVITQELPYFKKDGVFQSDAYKGVLEANRLTPGEFEAKLRQDIKNQRSRQLFETSMSVSQLQKNMEKELRSAKLNLEFIQLSAVEYSKNNPISKDEITQLLAKEDFRKKVEADFKANESSFQTQEQVKASHILIKSNSPDDPEALKKAQVTLKRLEKEDFGKVASQISDDPGSKSKKGDLGYFTKGKMVKEFEEAAFTLPIGKVSGLVKSNFGYHIIKVMDKKPESKADFEKVKFEIAQKMASTEQYSEFIKKVETDLVAGQLDSVLSVLTKNKMSWKETGFFDIASEVAPVMNSNQALKMGLELTKAQPVAKKLIREGDVQFLVKLKETKIEDSVVKPQDQDLLEKQKSTEAYSQWVESFKKTANIETNHSLMSVQQ